MPHVAYSENMSEKTTYIYSKAQTEKNMQFCAVANIYMARKQDEIQIVM